MNYLTCHQQQLLNLHHTNPLRIQRHHQPHTKTTLVHPPISPTTINHRHPNYYRTTPKSQTTSPNYQSPDPPDQSTNQQPLPNVYTHTPNPPYTPINQNTNYTDPLLRQQVLLLVPVGVGLKDLAERTGMTADQMTKLAEQHPDQVYEKMLEVVAKIKQGGGDPGAFLKEFGVQSGRSMQQIEALASKVDLLKKNIATSENPAGGANKFAEDMKNDFDKAVNEMTTAWTELKEQLGKDILPAATAGSSCSRARMSHDHPEDVPARAQGSLEAALLLGSAVCCQLRKAFGVLGRRAARLRTRSSAAPRSPKPQWRPWRSRPRSASAAMISRLGLRLWRGFRSRQDAPWACSAVQTISVRRA